MHGRSLRPLLCLTAAVGPALSQMTTSTGLVTGVSFDPVFSQLLWKMSNLTRSLGAWQCHRDDRPTSGRRLSRHISDQAIHPHIIRTGQRHFPGGDESRRHRGHIQYQDFKSAGRGWSLWYDFFLLERIPRRPSHIEEARLTCATSLSYPRKSSTYRWRL